MINIDRHITTSYYEAVNVYGDTAAVLVPNFLPLDIINIVGIIIISVLGIIILG